MSYRLKAAKSSGKRYIAQLRGIWHLLFIKDETEIETRLLGNPTRVIKACKLPASAHIELLAWGQMVSVVDTLFSIYVNKKKVYRVAIGLYLFINIIAWLLLWL